MISVQYTGPVVGLNQLYTMHWGRKKKAVDSIIAGLVIAGESIKNSYTVTLRANTRLDLDNNVGTLKIILDHLRRSDYLTDDSPSYFVGLTIKVDKTLPKQSLFVEIQPV